MMNEKFLLETFKEASGTYYGVFTTDQCEWTPKNELVGELDIEHKTLLMGWMGLELTPDELRELADYVEKHLRVKETNNE